MSTLEVVENFNTSLKSARRASAGLAREMPDYDISKKKKLLVEKRKLIREQLQLLIKRSCPNADNSELQKCIPGKKLTIEGIKAGEIIDDKYKVEKLLDSGSMGNIYLVRDIENGTVYAMKTLVEAVHSEKAVRRFIREAKELSKLDHKYIINVIDFGMSNGRPYYVMENLSRVFSSEPNNMDALIKMFHEQKVGLREMIRCFAQIAEALDYLHTRERTIIHRDLKPQNVLVNNKSIKLVDFGVASVSGLTVTTLTDVNEIIGTPHYIPITDWDGNKISPKSDMYSFGVMLYLLITKKLPFALEKTNIEQPTVDYVSGVQDLEACLIDTPAPILTPGSAYNNRKDSIIELFNRARNKEPAFEDVLPAIDEELVELVKRLLSKNPDDRPDAKSVVRSLYRIESSAQDPTPVYSMMRRDWQSSN